MHTTDTLTTVPDEVRAQLQAALANRSGGIRDPEAAREARQRMARIREENRRVFGEQNIAVELIRQTRDQA